MLPTSILSDHILRSLLHGLTKKKGFGIMKHLSRYLENIFHYNQTNNTLPKFLLGQTAMILI